MCRLFDTNVCDSSLHLLDPIHMCGGIPCRWGATVIYGEIPWDATFQQLRSLNRACPLPFSSPRPF